MPKYVAIVDTREQDVLELPSLRWRLVRSTLKAGDYTTPKLRGSYSVERKSLMDFMGTFTKKAARRRLCAAIQRAGHPIDVLVEASAEDLLYGRIEHCSCRNMTTFLRGAFELGAKEGFGIVFSSMGRAAAACILEAMLLGRESAK